MARSSGIVYAVQEPMRMSQTAGRPIRNNLDLSPAHKFGQLKFLLDWSDNAHSSIAHPEIFAVLCNKLSGFSDNDYILPVGNPSFIGAATAAAALANDGRVKLLNWVARHRRYEVWQFDAGHLWQESEPDNSTPYRRTTGY